MKVHDITYFTILHRLARVWAGPIREPVTYYQDTLRLIERVATGATR